jgi:hypothetical protein
VQRLVVTRRGPTDSNNPPLRSRPPTLGSAFDRVNRAPGRASDVSYLQDYSDNSEVSGVNLLRIQFVGFALVNNLAPDQDANGLSERKGFRNVLLDYDE